ncbi:MAG: histidine phosphatase family protein [Clostridiales bacterium]|nr:histidine phosphatase family protein [Clostridiales bacterium]
MKIIYIHHGNRKKCNPSTQNDDLTEIGYKDCELTAELFNNDKIKKSIKAIYTSPFFRCKKTAEIVNTYMNAPIICEDRLNEYKSMGEESWVECQNRIIEFIDEIITKYDNADTILCVTSGVNIGAFVVKFFGLNSSENIPFLGVPSCSPIIFEYDKDKK